MKVSPLTILKKIATHHTVVALQKSLISVIGVSFVAGLLLIIQNPPVTQLSRIAFITKDWANFATTNMALLDLGIQFTLGFIGVYTLIAFIIALCQHYQIDPFHPVLSGLGAYLILSVGLNITTEGVSLDYQYLGSSGILVAFLVGILVVEFNRLSLTLRAKIKTNNEISSRLAQPIEAALASLVVITLALIARYFLQQKGILIPDLFFNTLAPLLKSSNTIWFVLLVVILSKLCWFIGLNGNTLILVSLMPMMILLNSENLIAYQHDKALPYILTTGFLFFEMGVLPMVSAILLFSKNKAHRSSAKLGLLPSIFNFPETMILGLPLTFNGTYAIPFILSSVISLGGAYLVMVSFWVSKPLFVLSPALPGFLGAFLSTLDWKAVVLWFGLYLLSTLVYWPFIRKHNHLEAHMVSTPVQQAEPTVIE